MELVFLEDLETSVGISRLLSLLNNRIRILLFKYHSIFSRVAVAIELFYPVDVHRGATVAKVRGWNEVARSGARLAKEAKFRATDMLSC